MPKIDWKAFLASMDLFFRERLLKLSQLVSQDCDDEIVRTMLENKDTQPFAEQRITELIKDALCLDQEVLIETLQR